MEEEKPRMPDYMLPGAILKVYWSEGNNNNRRIHIRAIVDEHYVVYCYWSYGRQRWEYKIDDGYWFWLVDKNARVTVIKKGRQDG